MQDERRSRWSWFQSDDSEAEKNCEELQNDRDHDPDAAESDTPDIPPSESDLSLNDIGPEDIPSAADRKPDPEYDPPEGADSGDCSEDEPPLDADDEDENVDPDDDWQHDTDEEPDVDEVRNEIDERPKSS